MKRSKNLSANEILSLLETQWLGNKEIGLLACCGINKALEIRKKIEDKLKIENYYLPTGLVPTSEVIDFLHIDVNYLKKIAKIQNECGGKE